MPIPATLIDQLCRQCGICCNGVLFRDVELQPGDSPERLRKLGMPLKPYRGTQRFPQPCPAFMHGACRIYPDRPRHCRHFECLLLKSVADGHTEINQALRLIRTARQQADQVQRLLRRLGDTSEDLSLSRRFKQTTRQLERGGLDDETAELYGQLTLAVHDLNLILSQAFYPDLGAGME